MDYIKTETSKKISCILCGEVFKTEKAAKKHSRKHCRSIWLAFSPEGYKNLCNLIKGLAMSEEYRYFFETRSGIDLLYSLENVLSQESALDFIE